MSYRQDRAGTKGRKQSGSIMPLMAFAMLFAFAFLGFIMDVMREVTILAKLEHASAACALDLLPFAALDANGKPDNIPVCNSDGAFSAQALASMQAELARNNGDSASEVWNSVLINANGEGQGSQSEIRISPSDLLSVSALNAGGNDIEDPRLQVRARRSGDQAMELLFMPVRYTAELMSGNSIPQGYRVAELIRQAEVCGQPACRVGAAAAPSASGIRAQILFNGRLAAFPLAINYEDFKRLLHANNGAAEISAVLNAQSPGLAQSTDTAQLRAYFVNLKAGGSVGDYYNDAQSPTSVDELTGLIEYFSPQASGPKALELPAAVERGAILDRFSSTSYSASADMSEALQSIQPDSCYIMPVASEDGATGSQCRVVGFAFLKLAGLENNNGNWQFQVRLAESLPLPNASAGQRFRCIPAFDGSRMPELHDAAANPFRPRNFDPASSSLTARLPGILLAPMLLPRKTMFQSQ